MKSRLNYGRLALGVALALLLVPPAHAQSSLKPGDKELSDITARGLLLSGYDQAAGLATDAVQALHPPDGKITRYLAHKTATGWVVDFGRLDPERTAFLVAYEATQIHDGPFYNVSVLEPERRDTDFDLAADKAIGLALKDFGSANRPYNVAVLPANPDGGPGGLYVYLYPAQVKDGVFPYGGDVRYLVSADGGAIVARRQLHKTVLESVPAEIPKTKKTVAGTHTHVLGSLPEDTDVLLVLSRQPRIPEYVTAGGHIFVIETDGTILLTK